MTNLKPNKYYYIKHKYPERTIDRKLKKGWAGSYSCDVAEVLCDVPTYEELCIERKLIMDLSEENAQLKELLRECRDVMNMAGYVFAKVEDVEKAKDLIKKIDEVLK